MAGEQFNVFISYSRADSEFVDRLDADLRARGFSVWVDRRRLEGGQHWAQEIDAAIARCDLFLLTLSPSAVDSKYVRREFEEAERLGKRLLPVVFKNCVIPVWLASADKIQRQDFTETSASAYPLSLKRLLYAILDPTLNLSAPADQLYRNALQLRAAEPERAVIILQHLIDREPAYFGGQAQRDLAALQEDLYTTRVKRLHAQALHARQQGEYGIEAASLEALLALGDSDGQTYAWAKEYLPIARENRAMLGPYSIMQERLAEGDVATARSLLQNLWTQAPYFGDPAGLAPRLGLSLPHTYEHDKAVAAERMRFEQACAALRSNLSNRDLYDVRAELRQQNYDLSEPKAMALIEQMVELWHHHAQVLARATKNEQAHYYFSDLIDGTYGIDLVIIGLAICAPIACGMVGVPVVRGLPFGDAAHSDAIQGLSVIVGFAIAAGFLYLIYGRNARHARWIARSERQAAAIRAQANASFEQWRQLAERVCQRRIDVIDR